MGAGAGCGVVTPTGAFGDGVGSAMARGCGAGWVGALAATVFTGLGGVGGVTGVGGTGSTLGAGGSINCDSTSTGTTISAARIKSPLCNPQINSTCRTSTESAMMALRLRRGVLQGAFDEVMAGGRPRVGSPGAGGNAVALMIRVWG